MASGVALEDFAFFRRENASSRGGDGKAPDIMTADLCSVLRVYFFLGLRRLMWMKSLDMLNGGARRSRSRSSSLCKVQSSNLNFEEVGEVGQRLQTKPVYFVLSPDINNIGLPVDMSCAGSLLNALLVGRVEKIGEDENAAL